MNYFSTGELSRNAVPVSELLVHDLKSLHDALPALLGCHTLLDHQLNMELKDKSRVFMRLFLSPAAQQRNM